MARPLKKPNRDDRKGRVMPTAIMAAMLISLLIPNAAALDVGPAGLRANIVFTSGSAQEMEIRFPVIADDPDQDVGSYQYNVSVDQGSGFVDLGAVSALKNFAAWGGHQIGTVEFGGATAVTTVRVHAYDTGGMTESPVSCTVTVDTAVLYDYDSCGSMSTDFSTNPWCADRNPAETDGFDWRHRFEVRPLFDLGLFVFEAGDSDPGYAARDIPGDSNNWRFDFRLRAASDGGASKDSIHFSTVDTPPSQASVGNGNTNGAYTDGIRMEMLEVGSTWEVDVYWHDAGRLNNIISATYTSDPNTLTNGFLEIDHHAQIIRANIGAETFSASIPTFLGQNLTNVEGLWLKHGGPNQLIQTQYSREVGENSMCLFTSDAATGGSTATFAEPENQGIEDFSGQGGFGGAPVFPGMDVQGTADAFGMDVKFMGYVLGAILISSLAILGFVVASVPGGITGASVGMISATVLNLFPYWALILVLLFAVSIVVLTFGRNGGAE